MLQANWCSTYISVYWSVTLVLSNCVSVPSYMLLYSISRCIPPAVIVVFWKLLLPSLYIALCVLCQVHCCYPANTWVNPPLLSRHYNWLLIVHQEPIVWGSIGILLRICSLSFGSRTTCQLINFIYTIIILWELFTQAHFLWHSCVNVSVPVNINLEWLWKRQSCDSW